MGNAEKTRTKYKKKNRTEFWAPQWSTCTMYQTGDTVMARQSPYPHFPFIYALK